MFARNQRPEPDAIEVILGARATFSGDLRCDAGIRIDGAVESGRIETPSNVILTETARVQCEIVARVVSIRGYFRGNIIADRVEMLDGSQVHGSLMVNSFYMDEGAQMKASVNIRGSAPAEPVLPPPPSAPLPVSIPPVGNLPGAPARPALSPAALPSSLPPAQPPVLPTAPPSSQPGDEPPAGAL